MPKKKTSKTAAKRVRITASGKLKFTRPGRGHLLGGKSRTTKRHLRRARIMGHADAARIRNML